MKDEDNMGEHLTKLLDLCEKLLNIDDFISNGEMVSKTLESLPHLYESSIHHLLSPCKVIHNIAR